jgi:hypothetical protein
MKQRISKLQCWLVLLSLAASLQITLGYYDPAAQRWINRDPLPAPGEPNAFAFVANGPPTHFDSFGLFRDDWPGHKGSPRDWPGEKPGPPAAPPLEWGGCKFPLDFFDPKQPRDCAAHFRNCVRNGALVCTLYKLKVGSEWGKYWGDLAGLMCITAYTAVCVEEKNWCDQWNKDHGF